MNMHRFQFEQCVKSLLMLLIVLLVPGAHLYGQICNPTPLKFGVVAPGHTYHVDKLSTDALCFSSSTITGRHLVKIGSITQLTNGVDTITITFSPNDGSIRTSTTSLSNPISFDPVAGYLTPSATRGVEVRIGGTINVPFIISPGAYTGYIRVDIERQY